MRLGQVGQPLRLQFEPLVNLRRGREALVNLPRLVTQVQHHAVPHRLVKFVGVDVAPENLDALLLVRLEQGRAGETDEHRAGQNLLHRLVQLARLRAMALIHEHKQSALGFETGRQGRLHLLDELVRIAFLVSGLLAAELVNE